MASSPVPRHVFVAYYPEGPHAGPVTIGLFGFRDGALLPVFSSRQKAIDFAVRTLGSPPNPKESWDGVELPAADLIHLLLDDSVTYVAVNPLPSGTWNWSRLPSSSNASSPKPEIQTPQ